MVLKFGNVKIKLQPSNLTFSPDEIRELRSILNLPREAFAHSLGVSTQCVYNWEHGLKSPGHSSKQKLLRVVKTIAEKPGMAEVVLEEDASTSQQQGNSTPN